LKNRYISITVRLIATKFGTVTQFAPLERSAVKISNEGRAEREMSASACTRCMPGFCIAFSQFVVRLFFTFTKRNYTVEWFEWLWPPCIADADIIFLPCGFFYLLSSYSSSSFPSPNLSRLRLYVYHTFTHGVP